MHMHSWNPWKDLSEDDRKKGLLLQERRCRKCNKARRRVVTPVL